MGDLWALFHLDLHEQLDRPCIDVLWECMQRLPYEPRSMWRAKELGGEKWFGWDLPTSMQADLIDAVKFQTSATAVNKRAKLKHPVERPDPKKHKQVEDKPASVADMRWGDALASLGT